MSARAARVLAVVFLLTTLGLGGVLGWTWLSIRKLALAPIPEPALPAKMRPATAPVSPLQLQYQLNLPGRGEIFPGAGRRQSRGLLAGGGVEHCEYIIAAGAAGNNSAGQGWTEELRETAVIGPNEVRTFNLDPQLLPDAYRE